MSEGSGEGKCQQASLCLQATGYHYRLFVPGDFQDQQFQGADSIVSASILSLESRAQIDMCYQVKAWTN